MSARAIAGRIPDRNIEPIVRYFAEARRSGVRMEEGGLTSDDLLYCLLRAYIE